MGDVRSEAAPKNAPSLTLSDRCWQPIETAPKDGTLIIGAYFDQPWAESHREGQIVKCWYQPEFESFISGCHEMTLARGYTFEDGSSRQLHSPDKEAITHWMPLPSPPRSDEPNPSDALRASAASDVTPLPPDQG